MIENNIKVASFFFYFYFISIFLKFQHGIKVIGLEGM